MNDEPTPAVAMPAYTRRKSSSIAAVVTRADGTVEDLGVIAYWHRNPLRRLWWRYTQWRKHR